jgi:hypothetical protein
MTVVFLWADPRALCRVCGAAPEASAKHCLCDGCVGRAANWLRHRLPSTSALLASGPSWEVDELPESDARVIAYLAAFNADQEEWARLHRGDFHVWESEQWIASVLASPKGRKWLKLEDAA